MAAYNRYSSAFARSPDTSPKLRFYLPYIAIAIGKCLHKHKSECGSGSWIKLLRLFFSWHKQRRQNQLQ